MNNISLFLLLCASILCGASWAILAYSSYARKQGLPVGLLYDAQFSWIQGIAYLGFVGAIIAGILASGWWGPIAVIVIGNIITRLLFSATGFRTQIIAPILLLLSGIACTVILLIR